MKIAYFTHSIVPSAYADSIQSVSMCHALACRGHDVTLFAPDRAAPVPTSSDLFAYYHLEQQFRVVKVPWLLIRERTYLYSWKVVSVARKQGFDLYYSRATLEAMLTAMWGLPTIFESHVPVGGRFAKSLFRIAVRRNALKRLVVISDALADYYRRVYDLPSSLIVVARDAAINPDSHPVVTDGLALRKRRNCIQIGYAGALFVDKGIETILQLAAICPECDFHVVGGTPSEVTYWQANALSSNIHFYGMRSPAEMSYILRQFDIVLAPYRRNPPIADGYHDIIPWMSPMKLFEYMAAGKAIICSDLPAIREFLQHERNAILCPPDDVEAWRQSLRRLAADRSLRETLSREARQDIQEKYNWNRRAEAVMSGLS